jgi:transcriptional regulator with XRE-family HTH domain
MSSTRDYTAGEIRAHMGRQRKTGVQMAALLQISQQAASRRMNAEADFSLDELAAIAEWLNLSPLDLLPFGCERASA